MAFLFVLVVIILILAFLAEAIGFWGTVGVITLVIFLLWGAFHFLIDSNKPTTDESPESATKNSEDTETTIDKTQKKQKLKLLKSYNNNKQINKGLLGIILLVATGIVIIGIIIGSIVGFSKSTYESPEKEAYDDAMASYDWGDDYYYDSSEGSVKKNPW